MNMSGDFFNKISDDILFGMILGVFQEDGVEHVLKYRGISRSWKQRIDERINDMMTPIGSILDSQLPSSPPSKRFSPDNKDYSAESRTAQYECILRNLSFNTATCARECLINRSLYRITPFLPSSYTTFKLEQAKMLCDYTIRGNTTWLRFLFSLNRVLNLTILRSFFRCTCHKKERGPPCVSFSAKMVLIMQVIIRNRYSLNKLVLECDRQPSNDLQLRHSVPNLSSKCANDSNFSESDIFRLNKSTSNDTQSSEGPMIYVFSNLESIEWSHNLDVKHIVTFLDGCIFQKLRRVKIGLLEAQYHIFEPQFGRMPVAIFAPHHLYKNTKDPEAQHLPALYNGRVDEDYKLDGLGLYTCPIYCYEGHFERGLNENYGKMRANTGETYEGMWHKGLRCGHGRVEQEQGCIMEGTWNEDLLHGLGYIYKPEGFYFIGQWFHSGWDGWGIFVYNGRLIGYGQFQHGHLHGWCRMLDDREGGGWMDNWYLNGRKRCSIISDDTSLRRQLVTVYHEGHPYLFVLNFDTQDLQPEVYYKGIVPGQTKDTSTRSTHWGDGSKTSPKRIAESTPRVVRLSPTGHPMDPSPTLQTSLGCDGVRLRLPPGSLSNQNGSDMHAHLLVPTYTPEGEVTVSDVLIESPLERRLHSSSADTLCTSSAQTPVVTRDETYIIPGSYDGTAISPTARSPVRYTLTRILSTDSDLEEQLNVYRPESHEARRILRRQNAFSEELAESDDPTTEATDCEQVTVSSEETSIHSDAETDPPMAYNALSDLAQSLQWDEFEIVDSVDVARQPNGKPRIAKMSNGAAHVLLDPVENNKPKSSLRWLGGPCPGPRTLGNAPMYHNKARYGGEIRCTNNLMVVRPTDAPEWLGNYLYKHFGVAEPFGILPSNLLFNTDPSPFFSTTILDEMRSQAWIQHKDR